MENKIKKYSYIFKALLLGALCFIIVLPIGIYELSIQIVFFNLFFCLSLLYFIKKFDFEKNKKQIIALHLVPCLIYFPFFFKQGVEISLLVRLTPFLSLALSFILNFIEKIRNVKGIITLYTFLSILLVKLHFVNFNKVCDSENIYYKNGPSAHRLDELSKDLNEIKSNKVVVVDVWSRNCSACLRDFPKFNTLSENYKNDTTIEFISLYIPGKEKIDSTKINNLTKKYIFKNIFGNTSIVKKFNVFAYPTYLIFSKSGFLIYSGNLNIEEEDKRNYFPNLILKAKSI